VPLLIVLVIGAMRRRLVHPRIGKARVPASGAVPGLSIVLTVLFVTGLRAFLFFERSSPGATPSGLVWLLRGLLLAAAAALVALALRTGLMRFHVRAGAIVLSALGARMFFGTARVAVIAMVAVPGVVLLTAGVIAFTRFLRRYALPAYNSQAGTATRTRIEGPLPLIPTRAADTGRAGAVAPAPQGGFASGAARFDRSRFRRRMRP
jgi:hypothetical protein